MKDEELLLVGGLALFLFWNMKNESTVSQTSTGTTSTSTSGTSTTTGTTQTSKKVDVTMADCGRIPNPRIRNECYDQMGQAITAQAQGKYYKSVIDAYSGAVRSALKALSETGSAYSKLLQKNNARDSHYQSTSVNVNTANSENEAMHQGNENVENDIASSENFTTGSGGSLGYDEYEV